MLANVGGAHRGSVWRVSEERDLGTVVVRLEIVDEPTSSAVGRSLGRTFLQFLLGPFGNAADPSYSPSRVVRVSSDQPTEPEVFDYDHDYPSAQACFERLVRKAEAEQAG